MDRIQLFEFEDFHGLPKSIRNGVTRLIVVFHKMLGSGAVIANLIRDLRAEFNFSQIVDLGSGSGGAMPEVISILNKDLGDDPIKLILTDLHPNPEFMKEPGVKKLKHIEYWKHSVDATNIKDAPKGLKTMICSFHHMRPETAGKILRSAQDNKEVILIYELAANNVPLILWWLFLPISLVILILMAMFMTPFVRPLSFNQLFFTYLIPIIPLVYAWDGQASLKRTYTFKDIESMIKTFRSDAYTWKYGDAIKPNGKKAGYYLIGHPN